MKYEVNILMKYIREVRYIISLTGDIFVILCILSYLSSRPSSSLKFRLLIFLFVMTGSQAHIII